MNEPMPASNKSLRFAMYDDGRGEWRWTFHAENGEEIAVSSEGYKDKDSCKHGIKLVQELTRGADVFIEPRLGSVIPAPVTAPRKKRKVAKAKKRK